MDSFLVFSLFCLSDCLCMLVFVYARLPRVRSLLLRISRVCRSSARQVTLGSYYSIPSFFLCISIAPQIFARVGLGTCGLVVVLKVGTKYLLITPGIYIMLYYCLAMLVDGVWIVIHMEVMRVINLG